MFVTPAAAYEIGLGECLLNQAAVSRESLFMLETDVGLALVCELDICVKVRTTESPSHAFRSMAG